MYPLITIINGKDPRYQDKSYIANTLVNNLTVPGMYPQITIIIGNLWAGLTDWHLTEFEQTRQPSVDPGLYLLSDYNWNNNPNDQLSIPTKQF